MSTIYFKKNLPNAIRPTKGSEHAACMDLYAASIIIDHATKSVIVDTGLSTALPPGTALLVYGRSGLGAKHGLRPANGVGVIDADYRGPIKVILKYDNGPLIDIAYDQIIKVGDRIAQCMLVDVPTAFWVETDRLSDTERGEGGFGSTGTSFLMFEEAPTYEGINCPVCHSKNTEGGDFDIRPGGVSQECWCKSCKVEWVVRYHLAGCSIKATTH